MVCYLFFNKYIETIVWGLSQNDDEDSDKKVYLTFMIFLNDKDSPPDVIPCILIS
jgi:hypothetical protein